MAAKSTKKTGVKILTTARRKRVTAQVKKIDVARRKFDIELRKLKKIIDGIIWFRI